MDNLKIKHPEYGYVVFNNLTIRQQEILKNYELIKKRNEKNKKTIM